MVCSTHHQGQACEAMELFDEMIECELTLVGPHFQSLVQFCLEVHLPKVLSTYDIVHLPHVLYDSSVAFSFVMCSFFTLIVAADC